MGNSADCKIGECNEVLATPEYKFEYDGNGNPIKKIGKETVFFSYDALNRLTEIIYSDRKINFSYDSFSRLLSKETIFQNNIRKRDYLYDLENEIGAYERSSLIQFKVLGLGIKGEIGAAIAIELQGELFAPLHDFNGNIIALIGHDGRLSEIYKLDAFGRGEDTSWKNPWRYSSKRSEEGLIYFGSRFYDPALGRWLTPDPSGFAEGANLYVYVLNSPTNRLDLFGLESDPKLISPYLNWSINVIMNQINLINPNSLMKCQGKIGESNVDWVVRYDQMSKLNFTPEENMKGSFNLVDHLSEIVPKNGSMIGAMLFSNGIDTNFDEFMEMSESIASKVPEGTLFLGLHNKTRGTALDLGRAMMEYGGIDTPGINRTRQFLSSSINLIDKINPDMLITCIFHSEGGLIANKAIDGMMPKDKELLQKHMMIYTYGSASPISKETGLDVRNVYSSKDFLTGWNGFLHTDTGKAIKDLLFGEVGLMIGSKNNGHYNIQFVPCISPRNDKNFGFIDHAFMAPTSQYSLDDYLDKSKNIQKEKNY